MFEVMGRLWAAITGRNGKQQEKAVALFAYEFEAKIKNGYGWSKNHPERVF